MLGVDLLADDRRVGRAAADSEVVPADDDLAAADAPGPGDEVRGHEARQLPVVVIRSRSGQRSDLTERAVVEQRGDPLADSQPPGVVLPPDLVRAAHPLGELLPPAQLVQFRLPCHADKS